MVSADLKSFIVIPNLYSTKSELVWTQQNRTLNKFNVPQTLAEIQERRVSDLKLQIARQLI